MLSPEPEPDAQDILWFDNLEPGDQDLDECDDCHSLTVMAFHYDTGDGCHEVCSRCGHKRGFQENQAIV